jgi:hypothetical protein
MDPPVRSEMLRKATTRRSGRGAVLIDLDRDDEKDGERPCRSSLETAKLLPPFQFLFGRAMHPRGLPMVLEVPCPSIRLRTEVSGRSHRGGWGGVDWLVLGRLFALYGLDAIFLTACLV